MTIVIFVILGVIWVGVAASFLWGRVDEHPTDSIVSFRRQLHVLQRGAPVHVAPAHRLVRAVDVAPQAARAAARRRELQRRRREVMLLLVAATAASLLLGLLPALRPLWAVSMASLVALGAYVAALARMRSLAAERQAKVRFLPGATPEPALLLRRSAN